MSQTNPVCGFVAFGPAQQTEQTSVSDEHKRLRRIEAAARALHDLLWRVVGEGPGKVDISTTHPELAEDIKARFQDLKAALEGKAKP